MFDVFYFNNKPNLFAHEREVKSVEEAQALSRTRFFWIVDYLCDYSSFDFLWEPKPWEAHQRHVYASQWQKDSGTCLYPKSGYTDTQYHAGMIATRNPTQDNWDILDVEGFDYSWHPDPTEPPLIYVFGTQHQKTGGPTYTVPDAVNVKYVKENRVNKNTVDAYWEDTSFKDFDYSWHPDSTEAPYIYEFGTQHQKTGGPRYVVPGASIVKYVNSPRVTKTSVDANWDNTDYLGFDYSWHPDSTEEPYIYEFGTQWQKTGGPRYVMPGATITKYVNYPRVEKTTVDNHWNDLTFKDFDYTWSPDATEEPYIYQFGTQHQKTGGPRYTVPGATEVKYVNNGPRYNKTEVDSCWEDTSFEGFDYSWHPDDTEEPYIYQFGTQWQKTGGPRYVVPGAQEVKYVNNGPRYNKTSTDAYWDSLDYEGFDYSWHPDSTEEPMNYQFGTQWQKTGGPCYCMPGATVTKYVNKPRYNKTSVDSLWNDTSYDFDYSWHPDSTEEPYIYQFGTQWQKTGGPRYVVPGATVVKYVNEPRVNRTSIDSNWNDTSYNFDYSWHPDETEEPYIYQFGTQHQKTGGPQYVVEGATTVKYVNSPRVVIEEFSMDNWEIPENCTSEDFDFTWTPDETEEPYIYQFGTQHQKTGGPRYVAPGATVVKYVREPRMTVCTVDMSYWTVPEDIDADQFDFTWHPDETEEPYNYQFGTQWQKTGGPVYSMPGATVTKYVKEPRAVRIAEDDCWVLPHTEFGEFDFTWHPDATEEPMNYQFGTQWQKTGGPLYQVPGATKTKYVEQVKAEAINISHEVYLIDFGNPEADQVQKQLEGLGCKIKKRTRFISSYKGTLARLLKQETDEYVWVCSTVCDYSNFDFSWHPEQWQATMLNVFASEDQQFGDTFLINTPSFNERVNKVELLEWYNTIHFVDDISVPRWPIPVVKYNLDTIVDEVWKHTFVTPFALFTKEPSRAKELPGIINYWREKTRTVLPLSLDSSTAVIPREAKNHLKTQIYDYPFIDKDFRRTFASVPQDIVFISYDEPEAEKNYQKLKDRFPNAKRVHGVEGMENALVAAAKASDTPWYFAVFAKTELHEDFKFDFVPDYFQEPKHYIFHAINRANDLVYGEMAVIMYNCKMLIDRHGEEFEGLDYTLSFPHEVIPEVSAYGNFDTSPYHAWRTAFREVSKLYDIQEKSPSMDTKYRIKVWETKAKGEFAEWVLKGAADGREFYQEHKDDPSYRKNSFDWKWLRDYYNERYTAE